MNDLKLITPIYFVTCELTTDAAGDTSNTEKLRKVLATKKSIGQNEFYQAHTAGMKPELKFEVRSFEYKGESKLKLDGIYYNIIRTFDKQNGFIEITVEGDIHGVT